jgi:aspartate-semialdehyde dehydrogenase
MVEKTPDGFRRSRPMDRNSLDARRPGPINIALFDASTLVGKEVKALLRRRRFPVGEVRAFDTGLVEEGGNLTEFDGEAMLAVRPDPDALTQVDLAFFCGPVGTGEGFLDWPERNGFTAIDLTQSANRKDGVPVVNAGVNPKTIQKRPGIVASPHPISQFLSTLLAPLCRALAVEEVVSLVMQPASDAGEEGIEELYKQTLGVLSFAEVPKRRFDRVLAFNVIPASLGSPSGLSEEAIVREVKGILGAKPFLHTLRVLLVPVFHCHSFCCWVRFAHVVDRAGIQKALASESSLRIQEGAGAATPAELAGEEGILLQLHSDPSAPNGVWFWGVTDNLATGAALNAVRLAEDLLSSGLLDRRRTA